MSVFLLRRFRYIDWSYDILCFREDKVTGGGAGLGAAARFGVAVVVLLMSSSAVHAQFMRLGPLDVDASTSLSAIYTTNVEFQPKSESTLEREDYYLIYGLNLSLQGPTTPTADMTLNTAFTVEKHFVRDDLDNVSDPFGLVDFQHNMTLGRFDLPTSITYRREHTQDEGATTRVFIPGQRRERIVQDSMIYSQGILYRYGSLSLNANYSYQERRFEEEEFQEGDENQHTMSFGANWGMIRIDGQERVSLFYTYGRSKSELVNRPEAAGSDQWQEDQSVGLQFQLLTRPNLTYALAYQKSDSEDWRVTHTFAISDQWELSPVMILSANANYTIDEQPRDDDVRFTYSVGLAHEIDPTLRHNLQMTREPVDTFGSTTDTDSTTYTYSINKTGLILANVSLGGNVTHQINRPQGADAARDERTWRYTATLSHTKAMSSKLSRSLGYVYTYETTNTDSEAIDESRVTLTFNFTF